MKNEKTLLIGNLALTIARLEREIKLTDSKINQLWLEDFIPSKIKWEIRDETNNLESFKTFLNEIKEKESKK